MKIRILILMASVVLGGCQILPSPGGLSEEDLVQANADAVTQAELTYNATLDARERVSPHLEAAQDTHIGSGFLVLCGSLERSCDVRRRDCIECRRSGWGCSAACSGAEAICSAENACWDALFEIVVNAPIE